MSIDFDGHVTIALYMIDPQVELLADDEEIATPIANHPRASAARVALRAFLTG